MVASLCFVSAFIQIVVSGIQPYTQIFLRNKGFSYSVTGVVISLCELFKIAAPLLVSNYADMSGNTRRIVLLCSCVAAAGFSYATFTSSIPLVIAGVITAEIMCGITSPLFDGYVNRRIGNSADYGVIRSSGSAGYVVVLLISSFVAFPNPSDNRQILLSMLVKTGLCFIAFALFVKKEPAQAKTDKPEKRQDVVRALGSDFYIFFGLYALSRIAQSIPERLLSSYMTEVMGLGTQFTFYFAVGASAEIIVLIFGSRYINGRTDRCVNVLILSSLALVLRLLIYRMHPSVPVFAAAQLLHGLTFGAAHIAGTCFIASNVRKEHYTLCITIMSAVATAVPEMTGAFFGGFIIDKLGYDALFSIYSVFPAVSAFMLFLLRKRFR